ncbi:unnamed protein product [Malus baccata var. baccata]
MVVRLGGICSPPQSEVATASTAVVFAQQWLTEQVEVEGNRLMILQSFANRKVSFSRRKTNKVAHRLARFSLTLDHPVSWFKKPPDVIFDLLLEDSISS